MRSLVSVIIPTYKGNISLQRAIDSVLIQEYEKFEVIVVDDNDPKSEYRDITEMMMKKYANDTKVKYVQHERNLNGSAARNTGFRHSSGDYICLLDDDDYFYYGKISKQSDFLDSFSAFGAVYCWRVENEGTIISSNLEGDLTREMLLLDFTPYTSSIMIRRSCYEKIGGFDESYWRHQDFEFLIRFFQKFRIGVIPEALVRRDTNGVDNQLHGCELNELKSKFFEQFTDVIYKISQNDQSFKKRVLTSHYICVCKDHIRERKIFLAIETIISVVQICGGEFIVKLVGEYFNHVIRRLRLLRLRAIRYLGDFHVRQMTR